VGTALHVSLKPALRPESARAELALLDRRGPRACLGSGRGGNALAVPVKPDAHSLFGPRGACLLAAAGPLWVCDTGHHRLMGWAQAPDRDGLAADWVIGQPNERSEGRNARGAAAANTLNVPTGITACGAGFAVADAWNHRVLIWGSLPGRHNVAADVVLGQADFCAVESNRGSREAAPDSLFWPYGVHWDGARLWVADSGNRRVLMWSGLPQRCGQAADLVLGQASFHCRDENGGGDPTAASMRWPHAITLWDGKLCVTDAGNNRILVWDGVPSADNAPSRWVLGQRDFGSVDHNQSLYWPNAATLHMPYGIAAAGHWCVAADTANSRLIAWHAHDCHSGAPARALCGQDDFTAKGDNAWQLPTRQSLCWPYGIALCAGVAVVADSGNNRVVLWPLASELAS
jgi:hypothetical protein